MAAVFFGNKTDVEVETLLGCDEEALFTDLFEGVTFSACSFVVDFGGLGRKITMGVEQRRYWL